MIWKLNYPHIQLLLTSPLTLDLLETCTRLVQHRHWKIGTPMHMQKSWQSLTLYNSKRAGHVTPLRLKKKSNSSRSPKNTPPFSKRFLERYPNVLDLHNIVNNKI